MAIKVPPEVKAAFDKLKAENKMLKRRVHELEVENAELFGRASESRPVQRSGVQVTEATSKKWKLILLLGGLGMVFGGLIALVGNATNSTGQIWFGFLLLLSSFAVWLLGRFGKFWFHE